MGGGEAPIENGNKRETLFDEEERANVGTRLILMHKLFQLGCQLVPVQMGQCRKSFAHDHNVNGTPQRFKHVLVFLESLGIQHGLRTQRDRRGKATLFQRRIFRPTVDQKKFELLFVCQTPSPFLSSSGCSLFGPTNDWQHFRRRHKDRHLFRRGVVIVFIVVVVASIAVRIGQVVAVPAHSQTRVHRGYQFVVVLRQERRRRRRRRRRSPRLLFDGRVEPFPVLEFELGIQHLPFTGVRLHDFVNVGFLVRGVFAVKRYQSRPCQSFACRGSFFFLCDAVCRGFGFEFELQFVLGPFVSFLQRLLDGPIFGCNEFNPNRFRGPILQLLCSIPPQVGYNFQLPHIVQPLFQGISRQQ